MEIDIKIILGIITFISALVSTVITQIVLTRKFKKTIQENYRKVFFEKQLSAYQKFWTTLRPLSRLYDDNTILSKSNKNSEIIWFLNGKPTRKFCVEVTDFFFSEHGMFLGRKTRKHLFNLRNKLHYLVNLDNNIEEIIKLDSKARKQINGGVNDLITSIRKDIGVLNLKFNFDELEIEEKNNKNVKK